MHIDVPPELEQFVNSVVASGAFRNESEVLSEALRLLARREQLRHDVTVGLRQLDDGQYAEYDEDGLRRRIEQIKSDGRTRLAEENRRA